MLRLAMERSPFYRSKFAGIDIETCDVSDLPITTKPELMSHFDDVVTDRAVRLAEVQAFMEDTANLGKPYLGKYACCHTSGSQGQPLIMVQDRRQLDVIFALQLTRGNVKRPGVIEAIRRLATPARLAVVALPHGFYSSSVVWNHMPDAPKTFLDMRRFNLSDEGLIDELNAFRPNYITSYVSTLEMLALQKDRLKLHPDLQQMVVTSEEMTDAAYERLKKAFRVPVLNTYSMAECNHLSTGCPNTAGAHVNADWAILEVVDEQNAPVPPGELGAKVLVTNLANKVQPMIRYEIGDRVAWAAEPCGCGNNLPRLGRVGGRSTEFFWVRGEQGYKQLPALAITGALLQLGGVREWQGIQEERNRIRLRIEPLPDARIESEPLRLFLEDQIRSFGLTGIVTWQIEIVPRIHPDPKSGKMRHAISLVAPPQD